LPIENPEKTLKRLIGVSVTPEILIVDYILPGIFRVEDFEKYPETITQIREYLNSKDSEDSPIPKSKLEELRKDFDIPGLIGEVEFCFEETRRPEFFKTYPEKFGETIENLQQKLFELDQKFDPNLTKNNFDLKIGDDFNLEDLSQLFQNIKNELMKKNVDKKRGSMRQKLLKLVHGGNPKHKN